MGEMVGTVKKKGGRSFCGVDRHRMGTDGNGITTLAVFHGCPLQCKYCLNPQTLGPRYEDVVYYTPKKLYQEVKKDNLYFHRCGKQCAYIERNGS